MDFLYLLRLLLKRKWWIIGAAVIAGGIAWVLTMNQPKGYRSLAQVSTGFTVNDEIKMGTDNADIYSADVKFNNVIVTFMSPSVISLLSYNLILHDLTSSSPFRRLSPKQIASPVYQRIDPEQAVRVFENKLTTMSVLTSFKPEEKDLLEYLALYGYDYKSLTNTIAVYRLQRTDYIQIDCITSNPLLSAFIVNTIFPQFLRYYQNVRSSRSAESIDTLQSLMDKKKQDLDAKNDLLKKEGVLDVGEENASKLETIVNLETALTQEQAKQTQRNYELEKINQKLNELGRTPAPANKPAVNTTANDDVLTLKRNMTEAYQNYVIGGSSDPTLLKKYEALKTEYQNKISSLSTPEDGGTAPPLTEEERKEQLDKKSDVQVDIRAGSDNIEALNTKIAELRGNLVKDASKSAAIETLLKDAELANKEYLDAKQHYNDAVDITTSSVNNFRLVLAGQPAIDPEPSKRMLIVGMAGATAFVISILALVFMTYLDSSIKTPIIFSKMVNLKLICIINIMNLRQKNLIGLIVDRDNALNEKDDNRQNLFRESLRKLRYEVETSGKKTFLFASTKKGEGKTTLIQSLAYTMSMSKKKILIIDTNFCNNDLTVQLQADPILEKIHPDKTNPASIIEQVKMAAKEIGVTGVYAIGSEGGDYTPSEILPRENLLHHLSTLTAEYDYIFLEGPPLNDFSDTKELTQYVDGVIAVFSASHIIKQIDRQSMTFFSELNGKFCGAILNMVDLKDVNVS